MSLVSSEGEDAGGWAAAVEKELPVPASRTLVAWGL